MKDTKCKQCGQETYNEDARWSGYCSKYCELMAKKDSED